MRRRLMAGRQRSYRRFVGSIAALFLALGFANELVADPPDEQVDDGDDTPHESQPVRPAEDPAAPRRHFRIRNPGELSDAELEQLYQELKARMAAQYRLAGLSDIANYQSWTRYNNAP